MNTVLDGKIKLDGAVLALGMFDGVHIGHRVLLKKARALADAAGVPMVVCTFVQHPMALIAPEKAPPLLTTFDERARLLEKMNTDVLNAMPFDREMMNEPPEVYIGQLVRRFHPTDIVCGYNHSFGSKGSGSPALLQVLGGALGFRTSVVPKITLDGADVSSSAIRQELAQGHADMARRMLLRPYLREGIIAEKKGTDYLMIMPPNGKQTLPEQKYRALLTIGEKRYSAVVSIPRQGQAECRIPVELEPGSNVKIEFLSQLH